MTLVIFDNSDTGLYFFICCWSSFLWIVTTLAIFHDDGNMPNENDKLKSLLSGSAKDIAHSRSTLLLIPSAPEALDMLRPLNI